MKSACACLLATAMLCLVAACARVAPAPPPKAERSVASASQVPESPTLQTEAPGPEPTLPDTDRLVRYYRRKAKIAPSVVVRVVDLRPSAVSGVFEGTLVVGVGLDRQPFTTSADGTWASFAPLEDVTQNPFARVQKMISLVDVPVRGPADAAVTIVEYGDFQCPFSGRAYHVIEEQVLAQYGKDVRFAYKHYPLSMHPWAEAAAVAAECARNQGADAFWKVYRGLFENQSTIGPANLREKAHAFLAGSDVDLAVFDACFDGKETLPAVKAHADEAQALAVSGTPSFMINGRALMGAQPFESFQAVIDDELSQP
jgi:protein-disulfide isomerase